MSTPLSSDAREPEQSPGKEGDSVPQLRSFPASLENTSVLERYIRQRLTYFMRHYAQFHDKDDYEEELGHILNVEDISPDSVEVRKKTNASGTTEHLAVVAMRPKITPDGNLSESDKQEITLCNHISGITHSFETVLTAVIDSLQDLSHTAFQDLLLLEEFEKKRGRKLVVLPSISAVQVHSAFPNHSVVSEKHTIRHYHSLNISMSTYRESLQGVANRIGKCLQDPRVDKVVLEQGDRREISIHLLSFASDRIFENLVCSDFLMPQNATEMIPLNTNVPGVHEILNEVYSIPEFTETFSETDIEQVRRLLREAADNHDKVYYSFKKTDGKDTRVQIWGIQEKDT